MKSVSPTVQVLRTVTEYTRYYGLPAPAHPLLTVIDLTYFRTAPPVTGPVVAQLYIVLFKRGVKGSLHYGRQNYDFQEGVLLFIGPDQVVTGSADEDASTLSGWLLVFHPNLLAKYPLGQKITRYDFFAYAVHEALHISAHEESLLESVLRSIQLEYEQPIDAFSQDMLVAQLEVLLGYANRFYHRQFLTRRSVEHDLLSRFEALLTTHFAPDTATALPTVQQFADALHVSPAYLSDMLRTLTGHTVQQHLHHQLIEKAKRLLLGTSLTVSETAFQLGFEYPPYFSRLFKRKTGFSPSAFRFSAQ
ncbi:helix-turn-helix domain-containing protein [Hymenobacter sp. AT01-02]|uniref:helix-turn-helix domain-containing protein n=1 Tax=Hymenobacter sp. AT01-02 TaxID=1571877 RepID=UPI0005F0DF40|nr:response regulator transcription factor [Hymenobacter sp. AT01-02]